ncbi:U-box domain-containing protein 43-like isoform X2 [Sesamum indicum]|nr:U-box domain-containing protein 43-like isoform X2 [Sesamum indicum]XP_011094187.1 U-box domain-containing protein 43-like isoform X2 [Sesamum indicum]XP_011094195.1 U-box domain-containing protein 43-like isoform X2 [Sesamum indicum]
MVVDMATNSSPVEVVSHTTKAILEIIAASDSLLIQNKSFLQLSSYLDRIIPLLHELTTIDIIASQGLSNFLEILYHEIKEAKKLITDCSERSRFYILLNCRSIAKQIDDITKEITHALSCFSFASLNISLKIREDISQLVSEMQNADFGVAMAEEEILEKIESGMQERSIDPIYANNLLVSIAKAIGVSTQRSELRKEFNKLKSEIENLRLRKHDNEAIQLDQMIVLLEKADAASSLEDRENKYLSKRQSLGMQPSEPLLSFYCPITKEVMVDPVETPSGHTFERSAIMKWLLEADEPVCPLTSIPLDTSMLRPNKTLRQSIEEWKERNTMITIASLKSRLLSGQEEEVLHCLEQLKDLCEQREAHREWLVFENYIPSLVELLCVKNRDIRNRALLILCLLVKGNDDAKERIAKVENSIEPIVQFLGRRIGERKLAVTLLLELSKCGVVRDCIGKVQGCILLLVTMLGNTDRQAAKDAKNVLDNLSYSDDNVVLMAKNNYFRYLLERLSSDSDHVKMTMAKTLGEMELTDHNKSSLAESGVLDVLIVLVSHDDVEMKLVAIQALLNLASLKKNGQEMIKKGAVPPLLDILYQQTSPERLRELVAATIVHLALSTIPEGSHWTPVLMLESDEDISELFSLINLTSSPLQQNILQAFHAMCLSPSANAVKSKLRECSAVQTLFQLCEVDNIILRPSAVKLLCCLTEDGDETTMLEHLTQTSIETLLKLSKTSDDEEEIASTLGIIANLPNSTQISEWLLQSGNLPKIFSFIPDGKSSIHQNDQLTENAVGAICRLTVQTSVQLQKKVAEASIIPLLVKLLDIGTSSTIRRAAISLAQLSGSSPMLSRQISRHQGFWCFSSLPEEACPVHQGICTVESSFCLVEAGAIPPLIRVLRKPEPDVCEAALDALLTLINGEMLQNGCKVLAEANAMPVIIKLVSSPSSSLQEKVLNSLQRIFNLVEYKQKYGASAQMPLVDLTQRRDSSLKSLAAKILAQLNVLHNQSSYF